MKNLKQTVGIILLLMGTSSCVFPDMQELQEDAALHLCILENEMTCPREYCLLIYGEDGELFRREKIRSGRDTLVGLPSGKYFLIAYRKNPNFELRSTRSFSEVQVTDLRKDGGDLSSRGLWWCRTDVPVPVGCEECQYLQLEPQLIQMRLRVDLLLHGSGTSEVSRIFCELIGASNSVNLSTGETFVSRSSDMNSFCADLLENQCRWRLDVLGLDDREAPCLKCRMLMEDQSVHEVEFDLSEISRAVRSQRLSEVLLNPKLRLEKDASGKIRCSGEGMEYRVRKETVPLCMTSVRDSGKSQEAGIYVTSIRDAGREYLEAENQHCYLENGQFLLDEEILLPSYQSYDVFSYMPYVDQTKDKGRIPFCHNTDVLYSGSRIYNLSKRNRNVELDYRHLTAQMALEVQIDPSFDMDADGREDSISISPATFLEIEGFYEHAEMNIRNGVLTPDFNALAQKQVFFPEWKEDRWILRSPPICFFPMSGGKKNILRILVHHAGLEFPGKIETSFEPGKSVHYTVTVRHNALTLNSVLTDWAEKNTYMEIY